MASSQSEPFVVGPRGERLTRAELPDPDRDRWTSLRKARVVVAVDGGLITREAALERYRLSDEELDSWKAALSRFGMRGLRVTKMAATRGAALRSGELAGGAHHDRPPVLTAADQSD